jgi:hypothetical protein
MVHVSQYDKDNWRSSVGSFSIMLELSIVVDTARTGVEESMGDADLVFRDNTLMPNGEIPKGRPTPSGTTFLFLTLGRTISIVINLATECECSFSYGVAPLLLIG